MRFLLTLLLLSLSACTTDSSPPHPPAEYSNLTYSLYRQAKLESVDPYHGPFYLKRGGQTLLSIRRQWSNSDGSNGDGTVWITLPNDLVVGTKHDCYAVERLYHAEIETTFKGNGWALGADPITGVIHIDDIQANRIRLTIDCIVPPWRNSLEQPLTIRESRWISVSKIPASN